MYCIVFLIELGIHRFWIGLLGYAWSHEMVWI
uniref:Uncharacterized protein n=1 Tax=Arundo donax TaxID=35708 RepID=A0A0A9EEA9_ARUDO